MDVLWWLATRAAVVIAGLLLLPVLAWLSIVGGTVMYATHRAIKSDRSLWYHAGRASIYAPLFVRAPGFVIAALVGASVAVELSEAIDAAMESAPTSTHGNPPPELAPIREANLRMPTTYPFERVRLSAPWPPFFGHRFALGDR